MREIHGIKVSARLHCSVLLTEPVYMESNICKSCCRYRQARLDKLLEFKSKDGWEALCYFLGETVPYEPYPRVNDNDSFVELHKGMWWVTIRPWQEGGRNIGSCVCGRRCRLLLWSEV